MKLTQTLTFILVGASAVAAQADSNTGGSTIYDLLTAPNNTYNATTFVKYLSSDPAYQPIVDILKNPDAHTCFVPNNKAMEGASKLYKKYAKKHGFNATAAFPPANATFGNLSAIDVIKYHVSNGAVELASLDEYVSILKSDSGSGNDNDLPLLITNNATWNQFNDKNWLNSNRKNIKYNVGNGLKENRITNSDVKASNGYLNVVGKILVPPSDVNSTISHVKRTKTLSGMLKNHPEIAQYLNGLSNFTFFAPSNEALKGPSYTSINGDALKTLITSHLFDGLKTSADFPQGNSTLTNLNKQTVSVFVNGTQIRLNNDAPVEKKRNILTNNGIVHIVDKVIGGAPANSSQTTPTKSTAPTKKANFVKRADSSKNKSASRKSASSSKSLASRKSASLASKKHNSSKKHNGSKSQEATKTKHDKRTGGDTPNQSAASKIKAASRRSAASSRKVASKSSSNRSSKKSSSARKTSGHSSKKSSSARKTSGHSSKKSSSARKTSSSHDSKKSSSARKTTSSHDSKKSSSARKTTSSHDTKKSSTTTRSSKK